MLQLTNITHSYGERAVLAGVDLSVAPGQIVGLLGANGSGKTTLISIATGLLTPSGGEGRIGGLDAQANRRRAAALTGLAPQQLGIYPILSTRDNLRAFADLAGLRGASGRARIDEVLSLLDLEPQAGQRASDLSGGQQRRLHTGIAMLHEPELLFLDEPTVGADVRSRGRIIELVSTLAARGTAVVYTTHYLPELEVLDADIAVLHGGRIVATDSLHGFLERWASASVTLTFDGPAPELSGWLRDGATLSRAGAGAPGPLLSRAVSELGPDRDRLLDVAMRPMNLESAFLAITSEVSEHAA